MSINRYDTPAQAQFINTYSPIPFDEMMKIGLMKQARIDEGQKRADDATAALSAFKVAAPDEPAYLKKQGDYLKKLDTLYNETGNTGSMEFMRGVNKLRAEMSTDTDLRSMAQNYSTYNKMVTDVNEAAAKFGENSPAVYKARKQLQEFNNGAVNDKGEIVKGTTYIQQKTGMGILQPQGIGTPAAAQPVLDEYLAPVKADSVGTEGLDASGMFRVGNKNSGITYNKLGSVLGISFKDEIRNGKKTAVMDKVQVPADFYNTQAGMYMAQAAEQLADGSNGKMNKKQAFDALYADAALKSISSHVSSSSEQSLDVNPYYMESYKKKIAEEKPVYTTDFLIGSQNTGLDSIKAVDSAKDSLGTKIIDIEKTKEEYIAKNGVDKSTKDGDGRYVGSVLSEFDANIQQEKDKVTSLDNLIASIRKDKGIPDKWKITDDYTPEQIAQIEKEAEAVADKLVATPLGGRPNQEEWDKQYQYQLDKKMSEGSANYKKINEGLKANAAAGMLKVGVTSFPTTTDEKAMQDIIFKFTNEGVGKSDRLGGGGLLLTDAKTGKPYEVKDYEAMSRSSEDKFKPEVLGIFYDSKKGWPKIMIRAKKKSKDGGVEMLPAAYIDAPAGTEDIFIKAGKLSAAEVMIQRELADINTTPDLTGKLGDRSTGAKKTDYVDIRVLMPTRQTYNPEGDKYEATFTNFTTGEPLVKQFDTREDLIAAYIRYRQSKQEFETTGKVSGM
jgi:hypothetical protein